MQTFNLFIHLDRAIDEAEYDHLFEAGFDDAAPGIENGIGVLDVSRRAESRADAVESITRAVEQAGFKVTDIRASP
ncbi:hypothetical protein [Pseudoclavibacter sp. AY1H1]|uniref:hypothetical protein n=1 Tax=Pseudoclavibacter sp. AY1H1 TaxID=2080584 RepID=UPI000CE8A6F7|nr:hypothetical protein [Pseudoclavibacter sp. AY1H1]PPF32675.1 hypothetical protein C5E05_19415 [Pseudoclavibacter sp. AY1H1]